MTFKKNLLLILLSLVLIGCSTPDYNIEVDLTTEEKAILEDEVQKLNNAIQQMDDIGEGSDQRVIDLADAYKELGNYNMAIQTYEDAIGTPHESTVILHNLGRLYQNVNEPKKAIEAYLMIVENDSLKEYWYEVARVYADMDNLAKAEEYYQMWQDEFDETDGLIEQKLEKLREAS